MEKRKKEIVSIRSSAAEYLTYVASAGDDENSVEMRYEDENIWLTQKLMATLYDVKVNTINYHIKKVFEDLELDENSVIRKFRITANDGKPYDTLHYSLAMIIAVGFKVNSDQGRTRWTRTCCIWKVYIERIIREINTKTWKRLFIRQFKINAEILFVLF